MMCRNYAHGFYLYNVYATSTGCELSVYLWRNFIVLVINVFILDSDGTDIGFRFLYAAMRAYINFVVAPKTSAYVYVGQGCGTFAIFQSRFSK